jgi:hypothetical protein
MAPQDLVSRATGPVDGHDLLELGEQPADLGRCEVAGLRERLTALQGGDVSPNPAAALLAQGLQASLEERIWAVPALGDRTLKRAGGMDLHLALLKGLLCQRGQTRRQAGTAGPEAMTIL